MIMLNSWFRIHRTGNLFLIMKRDPPTTPYNPLSAIPLPPIPDNADFVTLKGGLFHPPPSKSKYCRWIIWYHIQKLFVTFPPSQKVHFWSISSSYGVNCIICPPDIKVHYILSALEYKLYTSLYHTKVKNAKIYAISPFLQGSLFWYPD